MPTEIHPTAIVDPGAELGENVTIGPYAVIRAGVTLGDGCVVHNHVTLDGPSEIGPENVFFSHASIGQRTQDLKYRGEPTWLRIGRGNVFREFVTVNRATFPGDATLIGSHGNFLAYSHVGHDCVVGDHCIFSNNGTLGGHVIVGDHVIVSGLTAVHQFCRIGDHVITGGCSKITQDIPPFMMVDGNPARVRAVNVVGLRRRGFSEEAIRTAKRAHRKLYRENLTVSKALEELAALEDPHGLVAQIVDFVKASERGIH
ncbi:MAG: acyl-ACP--UDP-N-acetylglucosamine O-acyltransferase [Verrucomicrobiae bacterium]|nr:acyl-ACP--UDP-N-acetylglucosamine O-acyltransferase [Verrucomicrobiae bacterium]MCP5550495.1 acyl-ACP--UDP-N-acetylglucosamine O-acyltransferase [Akkermansiaceae bacterium]